MSKLRVNFKTSPLSCAIDPNNEEKEVMIGLRSQSVRRQDKRRGREKDVELTAVCDHCHAMLHRKYDQRRRVF